MMARRVLRVALLLPASCLSAVTPAEAYLDPGTGSMLVSAVIGVAAAVGLAVKMFWYRIVGLFRAKEADGTPGAAGGAPPAKE